ncbi:MAG: hypothetical protein RLZZ127_3025 [Planctomycetota bacterium]|jgi:hypothetical protein
MIPANESERLVADAIANALRGTLSLGPMDMMRLASAAREVPPERIADLALRRWAAVDPRAAHLLRGALLAVMDRSQHPRG